MTTRRILALFATGLLAGTAFGQTFVGSDDFNGGQTAKWDYVYRLNGATQGLLDFSNNRLDFSKAGAGAGNQFRLWDSDGTNAPNVIASSYTTSWSMTLSTTNLLSGFTGSDFANIGIQVFNDANSYSALMLSANSNGLMIRSEGTGFSTGSVAAPANSDVLLRLSWDANSHNLDAAYSIDGTSYTHVSTFSPLAQWDNSVGGTAVNNGFNFGVFGNSNTAGAIAVGSVYADNFAVSAIPEPSTYAALAGVGALGLAAWRKRRRASLASAE